MAKVQQEKNQRQAQTFFSMKAQTFRMASGVTMGGANAKPYITPGAAFLITSNGLTKVIKRSGVAHIFTNKPTLSSGQRRPSMVKMPRPWASLMGGEPRGRPLVQVKPHQGKQRGGEFLAVKYHSQNHRKNNLLRPALPFFQWSSHY